MSNKDRNFEVILSFNVESVKEFYSNFVAYANIEYIGQHQTSDKHYMFLVIYLNFVAKLIQSAQQNENAKEYLETLREFIENLPYVSQKICLVKNPISQKLFMIYAKHTDLSFTFEFKSKGFSFWNNIFANSSFGDFAYMALYILFKYMNISIPFTEDNSAYYYRLQQFLLLSLWREDYKSMSDSELSIECVEAAKHFFTYDEN